MAGPTGQVLWVYLRAGPGPVPPTLEPIPDVSRHHRQTQRKIEVQWTDPEKDLGKYDTIYVQIIDDAYFDYT